MKRKVKNSICLEKTIVAELECGHLKSIRTPFMVAEYFCTECTKIKQHNQTRLSKAFQLSANNCSVCTIPTFYQICLGCCLKQNLDMKFILNQKPNTCEPGDSE